MKAIIFDYSKIKHEELKKQAHKEYFKNQDLIFKWTQKLKANIPHNAIANWVFAEYLLMYLYPKYIRSTEPWTIWDFKNPETWSYIDLKSMNSTRSIYDLIKTDYPLYLQAKTAEKAKNFCLKQVINISQFFYVYAILNESEKTITFIHSTAFELINILEQKVITENPRSSKYQDNQIDNYKLIPDYENIEFIKEI